MVSPSDAPTVPLDWQSVLNYADNSWLNPIQGEPNGLNMREWISAGVISNVDRMWPQITAVAEVLLASPRALTHRAIVGTVGRAQAA
jgi:hypothetical protein